MTVCREYKVSHSEFLSWSPEDRGKAIAFEHYLLSKCPRCGTSEDDWMGEDGMPLPEPMWRSIIRHCPGCEERGAVDQAIPTEQRERGYFVTWVPTDDWDPSMDEVIDDLAALPKKQKLILPPSLA